MEFRGTQVILELEEYEALLHRIKELEKTVRLLLQQNQGLQERIKELENRLSRNSGNSHQPPSSDGHRKEIKNNREKSENKAGAQN